MDKLKKAFFVLLILLGAIVSISGLKVAADDYTQPPKPPIVTVP